MLLLMYLAGCFCCCPSLSEYEAKAPPPELDYVVGTWVCENETGFEIGAQGSYQQFNKRYISPVHRTTSWETNPAAVWVDQASWMGMEIQGSRIMLGSTDENHCLAPVFAALDYPESRPKGQCLKVRSPPESKHVGVFEDDAGSRILIRPNGFVSYTWKDTSGRWVYGTGVFHPQNMQIIACGASAVALTAGVGGALIVGGMTLKQTASSVPDLLPAPKVVPQSSSGGGDVDFDFDFD